MYVAKPGDKRIIALMRALGLPDGVRSFDIRFRMDELVRIEYYPEGKDVTNFMDKLLELSPERADESGEDG